MKIKNGGATTKVEKEPATGWINQGVKIISSRERVGGGNGLLTQALFGSE
jgi:hypothetical protein